MRAEHSLILAALMLSPSHAFAQSDDPLSKVQIILTEDGAPTARPWEKAAIISGTIDRNGRDYFEVHANADLQIDLLDDMDINGPTRTLTMGPSISWDRSTREGREQNEWKAGTVIYYYVDPNFTIIDPNSNPLFWSVQAGVDFASTAVYPDRNKAPCTAAGPNPLCTIQHNQSVRGKISVFPYLATFEDVSADGRLAYSFRPQIQLAHDEILDGTLNPATLQKVTGGYTSVLIGAGLNLRPSFILPQFEFNATLQLRQRLAASGAREQAIEKSAERMELSATYFLKQDDLNPTTKNLRVGLSVTWIEGSDPFENRPKASTIMFGLRIGRF